MHFTLTTAAGKRLIGKAVAGQLAKSEVLGSGTIVIIAGTTNGYVAEELLTFLNQSDGFSRMHFFRGITIPPGRKTTTSGRLPDESQFSGDVVIKNGTWIKGKTVFDVIDDLKKDDIVVKGANSINAQRTKAGILIGHPKGGTIMAALQAVIGRRARLILPVGLEKRVLEDIDQLAQILNSPRNTGPRFLPVTGEIVSEIEAFNYLTSVQAQLVASGGVCGAEGAVWITIEGTDGQIQKATDILESVRYEPQFAF